MRCPACKAEVPDGKLVCDCFQMRADQERELRGMRDYLAQTGRGWLTMGLTPMHIIISTEYVLTLCRGKRLTRLSDRSHTGTLNRFVLTQERMPLSFCAACWKRAQSLIAEDTRRHLLKAAGSTKPV